MSTTTTTTAPAPAKPRAQPHSAAASLRALYPRAARAFLHRDIARTHALVASALDLLAAAPPAPDDLALAEQRRKWDILRVTLAVTVYSAPPGDAAQVPAPLRANAMLSGAALAGALYAQSLQLFAPAGAAADAGYLPGAVVVTLASASVKVGAPGVGRGLVEEWLARRGMVAADGEEGYEKVVDVYCTGVLPALGEWEYAAEFLEYESEMEREHKQKLVSTLASMRERHDAALAAPAPSSSAPSSSTPRALSPSSSTSSLSTTSTQTVVPQRAISGLTPLSSTPPKPESSASERTVSPPRTIRERRAGPSFRLPPLSNEQTVATPARTSLAAVLGALRGMIGHYALHGLSVSQLAAALAIALVPLLSFVLRLRQQRSAGGTSVSNVRRRLGVEGQAGVLRALWNEIAQAVGDTVRMGGRGLV